MNNAIVKESKNESNEKETDRRAGRLKNDVVAAGQENDDEGTPFFRITQRLQHLVPSGSVVSEIRGQEKPTVSSQQ